jgi:hypothetical protein
VVDTIRAAKENRSTRRGSVPRRKLGTLRNRSCVMLARKFVGLLALSALAIGLPAAEMTASLKAGKAGLQSAGVMAFGPDGILFVGDSTGGAVWALDSGDRKASPAKPVEIAAANQKIAAMLGTRFSSTTWPSTRSPSGCTSVCRADVARKRRA